MRSRTLPARSSIIFPTVIREGNPCGFMIVSNFNPCYRSAVALQGGFTRVYPLVIERHIFLVYDQSTDTLLTMPRGKFVAQLRSPRLVDEHLDECLIILRFADEHFI